MASGFEPFWLKARANYRVWSSLAAHAKRNGRKVSDVIREAVDAALLGVTTDELKLLDEASRKASEHINAMRDDLAGNSKDYKSFLRAMTKLQNAS